MGSRALPRSAVRLPQPAVPVRRLNILDTPRFNNPNGNVSNLRQNPDGSVRDLNGFTEITGTVGGSQRQLRLGVRFGS